jgi:hypothetical protein
MGRKGKSKKQHNNRQPHHTKPNQTFPQSLVPLKIVVRIGIHFLVIASTRQPRRELSALLDIALVACRTAECTRVVEGRNRAAVTIANVARPSE